MDRTDIVGKLREALALAKQTNSDLLVYLISVALAEAEQFQPPPSRPAVH
ncbi:hypothetical protein SAMN05880590_1345 [Rhizobium sp. RU35A]|nr:hypothetical protein [Rhizobium sp. RU35A]SIR43774.1 hypothetical protein SAMN05880590_1345 [Rhizobium sp. RU35A]